MTTNGEKKFNHKLKSYLVLQYLLKNTDENHAKSGFEIAAYIQTTYDISAERRSIYRDIDEITINVLWIQEKWGLYSKTMIIVGLL